MDEAGTKMLRVPVHYLLGDVVYQKVCSERSAGMVTMIHISPGGPAYRVSWDGGSETTHYAIELVSEFNPQYVE